MHDDGRPIDPRATAKRLFARLKLGEADFDAENRLPIQLPGGIRADLVLMEDQGMILATAGLMSAQEANAAQLSWLACANADWAAQAGCIFSIPRASLMICVSAALRADESLEGDFGVFARLASMLLEQISALGTKRGTAQDNG